MTSDQLHRTLSLRLSLLRKVSDTNVRFEQMAPSEPAEPVSGGLVLEPPEAQATQTGSCRSDTQHEASTARDDELQHEASASRLRPPTRQSFERVSSSDLDADADADADDDSAGIGLLEQNIVCYVELQLMFFDPSTRN